MPGVVDNGCLTFIWCVATLQKTNEQVYDQGLLQLCSMYKRKITVIIPIAIRNTSGYSSNNFFMARGCKRLQDKSIILRNPNEFIPIFLLK